MIVFTGIKIVYHIGKCIKNHVYPAKICWKIYGLWKGVMIHMKKRAIMVAGVLLCAALLGGCGGESVPQETSADMSAAAEETAEEAAAEDDTEESQREEAEDTSAESAAEKEGAGEVQLPDGVYSAKFETDSSMFHVSEACEGRGTLTVENGKMTIHISLGSKKILNLYLGLAEDAEKEGAELLMPTEDTVTYSDGMTEEVYGFDVPVPVLEEEFDLALIGTKGKWYDHKVSVSNPVPLEDQGADMGEIADGTYTAELTFEGGSGKAKVLSPATITVTEGKAAALIEWSSPNYDYMIVDGEKYLPVNTEGNSVFEIPVAAFDVPIEVIGDTVAMSKPHEVEYTLTFRRETLKPVVTGALELEYAENFTVEYQEDGSTLLTTTMDGKKFLILPEDGQAPENPGEETTVLRRPVKDIYLVASSAMDMFSELDGLEAISFSGQKAENWYVEAARKAMERGDIVYAGKYNRPDYERIVAGNCSLAIENMMVSHSPEVLEKLGEFGIPVMIDYSSYESHPLGRVEWVKFYGALLGKEQEAAEIFDSQRRIVEEVSGEEKTGKTVAFFFITSNGLVQVRQSSDYIPKMIELAGGRYVFENLGESDTKRSTMNMQVEEFYRGAKDADFLIYNSSIDGGVSSVEELLGKCEVLADFRAVKEGNVWCTTNDMYQQPLSIGDLTEDIHAMLKGERDGMHYLFQLE